MYQVQSIEKVVLNRSKLIEALGKRIIFVDETSFSLSTVLHRGFSIKNTNCYHPLVKKHPEYLHVVAGISYEHGLEGFTISKKAINSKIFLQILE
jgi:hypothetical protein